MSTECFQQSVFDSHRSFLHREPAFSDANAAAGDHIVTTGRLLPRACCNRSPALISRLVVRSETWSTCCRAHGGRPFHAVEPEEKVGDLRDHVGILHVVQHRDDHLVVDLGFFDRIPESLEVFLRDTGILDFRQPSFVGVRVEKLRRSDVRSRRFTAEILSFGGDPIEERGCDLSVDREARLLKVFRKDRRRGAVVGTQIQKGTPLYWAYAGW